MVYPENLDLFKLKHLLKDTPEIKFKDEGSYTLVTYMVAFTDTFSSNEARECRGIIFDSKTGVVIRRPFHKFFNLNEKEYTQEALLSSVGVRNVSKKLDGSMLSPFIDPQTGEIIWGTKGVSSDFIKHIADNKLISQELNSYVKDKLEEHKSPVFEFHDPAFDQSVIVIQYKKAFIRLLAIRDMETGEYTSREELEIQNEEFPFLNLVDEVKLDNLEQAKGYVKDLEGEEGVVITFNNGKRVKLKCSWYILRHKVKEIFSNKNIQAQLILGRHKSLELDDIYSLFTPEQIVDFDDFSKELKDIIISTAENVSEIATKYKTKKDFGLSKKDKYALTISNLVFKDISGTFKDKTDIILGVTELFCKKTAKKEMFETFLKEMRQAI